MSSGNVSAESSEYQNLTKGYKMTQYLKQEYAVFTVCNLAYLPKALVLAESLFKFDSVKLNIYLVDKKVDVDLPNLTADINWIEDVGIPNLYQLAFKYDITEFSTSIKPWISLRLMGKYNKVVFLDPDICMYNSISPILSELDDHPIVLTPHYTTPHPDILPDSDMGMMRFGSFNLGFFAVNSSDQGLYFLNWWNDRCLRFCYFESQFGLSTDQKWVSIAPCFFNEMHISFNMGYNVAFWNLHERVITKGVNGGYLVNNKYPLVFFHFSSFDENKPEQLSTRSFPEQYEVQPEIIQLSREYNAELQRYKIGASYIKYGFDYMSSGDYISPTLRRAYASVVHEMPSDHDPFDSNGIVGDFAKKNHLIERSNRPYVLAGYNNVKDHKIIFSLINKMLRAILMILGPNRFQNVSRLMVYLSSYRQNRNLWKFTR